MSRAFLDLTAAEIAARVQAPADKAAGGPVVVRVGDAVCGYRNVGVDVPPARRSAAEARILRTRVRDALETAGVTMAETALAPKVGGDLRGNVHAAEVPVNWSDASSLAGPPPPPRQR